MLQPLANLKMKKTKLLSPMLMIFLFCLIFTSTLVVQGMALVADDDDDARDVKVEATGKEATIESELKTEEGKNEFKIEVSASDGIEVNLDYKNEADDEEPDLEFKVNFYELIEYVDLDDDGVYNASEDDPIKTVSLNDFNDIVYSTGTNEEDMTVHNITISTTDGVFTCKIFAVGEFANISESVVTPTEIKIDFEIHGFSYDNANSDLALNIKVESTGEYIMADETQGEKEGYATDPESGFEVTMGDFYGYFSWTEDVTVDGVSQEVKTSPFEDADSDGTEQKFYLNYPRGDVIVHDPKMGFVDAPPASTPSEIVSNLLAILELSKEGYLASVAAFTLLVISVVVLYRRKRW